MSAPLAARARLRARCAADAARLDDIARALRRGDLTPDEERAARGALATIAAAPLDAADDAWLPLREIASLTGASLKSLRRHASAGAGVKDQAGRWRMRLSQVRVRPYRRPATW